MLLHGEMNAICFGDVLNNYHHGWGEYSIEYVLDDNNTHTNGGLNFWKPWGNTYDNAAHNNIMFLANNSYVGIGTGSPTHKLTVNGWISCEGVKVISAVGADFVFSDNYKLLSLAEVEDFINKNKHLPEIASAEEMAKDGVDMNELQIKLLQKIEELTLYMIQLQNDNEELKNKVNSLMGK